MSTIMKNVFLRSISALLAFLTVFGMLVGLSMIPVFAADDTTGSDGPKETIELTYEEELKNKYIKGVEYVDGNKVDVDFSTP